jgi:hypothetical protein
LQEFPNGKGAVSADSEYGADPEAQLQYIDPEAKRREYENTLRSNLSEEMYSKKVALI